LKNSNPRSAISRDNYCNAVLGMRGSFGRRTHGPSFYSDLTCYDSVPDQCTDEREKMVLADRQLAPPVRAEGLRFLIHFVCDIHQPLHAADNGDRGGNEVKFILGRRRRTNLHAIWDTALVQTLGRDAAIVADDLASRITPVERNSWQAGDARARANESFRVASSEIYAKLPGSGGPAVPIIPSRQLRLVGKNSRIRPIGESGGPSWHGSEPNIPISDATKLSDAADKRINHAIDTMNQIRDRLTILEIKFDDHVRTTAWVR
jgi:hypothetical protein